MIFKFNDYFSWEHVGFPWADICPQYDINGRNDIFVDVEITDAKTRVVPDRGDEVAELYFDDNCSITFGVSDEKDEYIDSGMTEDGLKKFLAKFGVAVTDQDIKELIEDAKAVAGKKAAEVFDWDDYYRQTCDCDYSNRWI